MLASNLRLRNDKLQRIIAISLINGMVQDTNRPQNMSRHPDLAREIRRIGNDLLALRLELHALTGLATLLHRGLDAADLAVLVQELVDGGVEHVSAAVDGGQAGKALGKLAEAVERVDVWRLSVAGHGVDVETDTVDGLSADAGLVDVFVGLVEGHRVADEVTGAVLETELVVDFLHCALREVHSCKQRHEPAMSITLHLISSRPERKEKKKGLIAYHYEY